MKKIFQIFAVGIVVFLSYQVLYQPPKIKQMNNLVDTHPTTNVFFDGFEQAKKFYDLFPDDFSRWHEIIMQQNTRTIRRPVIPCMLNRYDCSIDKTLGNYIQLDDSRKFAGKHSLKFHAEPFDTKFFGDSKAAIRRQLLNFKKGDDIYFSAWFYFEDNDPNLKEHHNLSFIGFRSKAKNPRYIGEPGRRLQLEGKNVVFSDTDNWLPQPPIFRQRLLEQIPIPEEEWFNIRVHMKLSDTNSGIMDVWQGDKKLISEKGATLPESDTVYSILELGILNNQNEKFAQTLYVDDVWISPSKFKNK